MYTCCNARSDDEGNVYVGVDNEEVVNEAGDGDGDVVHDEGGLDKVEEGLHHCRKVQVKVEGGGVYKLLLGL